MNGLKKDSLRRISRLVIPVTGLSEEDNVPGKEIAPDQLMMAHMRVEEGRRKTRNVSKSSAPRRTEAKKSVMVRKGETLMGIAKKNGVSVAALARANGLSGNARIKAGTRLVLPGGGSRASKNQDKVVRNKADRNKADRSKVVRQKTVRTKVVRHKVHRGDTLEKIARSYGVDADAIAERNRLTQDRQLLRGAVLIIPRES